MGKVKLIVYECFTGKQNDAWGKLIGITNSAGTSIINKQTTSTSLANLNPLRYRGYYYDNETGFYYLQSRYYDPAVKRFINADIYTSTDSADAVSCNMFVYCRNNPVITADEDGECPNVIIGAIVGAVINTAFAVLERKPVDEVIVSAVCGAVGGGLTAMGLGVVGGAVSSFVDSAYGNAKKVASNKMSIGQAIVETAVDTTLGTAFGAMGSGTTADIAKGNRIFSAGWNGLKTLVQESVHPAVKSTAKKALKAAVKYTVKTTVSEFVSTAITTVISKGVNKLTGKVYGAYMSAY